MAWNICYIIIFEPQSTTTEIVIGFLVMYMWVVFKCLNILNRKVYAYFIYMSFKEIDVTLHQCMLVVGVWGLFYLT